MDSTNRAGATAAAGRFTSRSTTVGSGITYRTPSNTGDAQQPSNSLQHSHLSISSCWQAQALGIRHVVLEIDGTPTYVESYRAQIHALQQNYGIEALATGDILDVCEVGLKLRCLTSHASPRTRLC